MNKEYKFSIEESAALLHAIFPNYPDLRDMHPVPELGEFFRSLQPLYFETSGPLRTAWPPGRAG